MLKPLLALILTINAAFGSVAIAASSQEQSPEVSVLTIENSESNSADPSDILPDPKSIQTVQVSDLSLDQVNEILSAMPKAENTEFVLSTDEDEVVQSIAQNQSDKFSSVLYFKKGLTKIRDVAVRYRTTALQDKFGLLLTTVSFGYDSIKWVQCSHMSTLQTLSMLSFNFLLTASFGVHKDLWAKATKPVESRVRSLLDKISTTNSTGTSATEVLNDVSAKLISSLVLSTSIQVGRMIIYNGDHILSLPNIARLSGTALLLAATLSYSQFAWDEQIATVSNEGQPGAKFVWRRLKEIRGLMMSYVAPSSKLLQPDKFSVLPWVVSFVHGTVGILVYSNSGWLSDKLESIVKKIPLNTKNKLKDRFGESEKFRCEASL